MRHLAIIPARGGSKRLPRKNVLSFLGKPIIAYTIAAAQQSGVFDRVIVSTDDQEITGIAEARACEVDRRAPALATDQATINDVCFELLDRLEDEGNIFGTITVLYATAPLRNASDVRATHALLQRGACDFSMAVTEYEQPVHQALVCSDGVLRPIFPDLVSMRASSVGRYFAGNGSTYCAYVSAFCEKRNFYGSPLRGHVMPRERSIDIDEASDFQLAEFYGRTVLSEAETMREAP